MSDMNTSGAMNIGDAVLEFLADTTKLDQGIDGIQARVTSGMAGASAATEAFGEQLDATGENAEFAGEKIQDSMKTATYSTREARGEAMLLGEAFGVHLPRHVTSFISTLPGVGEALSAAFAATAVLFIIEAIVKLTEKVTDFISTTFMYTDTMKAADAATASLNGEILKQEDALKKAQEKFDAVGKSAKELFDMKMKSELADRLKEINDVLTQSNAKLQEQEQWWKRAGFAVTDWLGVTTHAADLEEKRTIERLNNETQAEKAREEAQKVIDKERAAHNAEIAEKQAAVYKKEMSDLATYEEGVKLKVMQTVDEIDDGLRKLSVARSVPSLGDEVQIAGLLKYETAARSLGITLRSDLVTALQAAEKAFKDMQDSGVKAGAKEWDDAAVKVKEAKDALTAYDTVATKTTQELLGMGLELKKGKDDWQALSTAYGSAVSEAIVAGGNLGRAVEKATEAELSAISSKAIVQAIYYTGLGFAALAGFEDESAANYFEAAGILASIGVGAGVTAHAMGGSGAGGGGGSNGQGNPNAPIQTTGSTSQTTATSTNVQHFAGGSLVTRPTLAVIGDAPGGGSASEGVLPLDNPEAMARIAQAITAHMESSGGLQMHTHIRGGVIDSSTLRSVMKQMSKKIKNGTGLLHASNTFRVTRRSA